MPSRKKQKTTKVNDPAILRRSQQWTRRTIVSVQLNIQRNTSGKRKGVVMINRSFQTSVRRTRAVRRIGRQQRSLVVTTRQKARRFRVIDRNDTEAQHQTAVRKEVSRRNRPSRLYRWGQRFFSRRPWYPSKRHGYPNRWWLHLIVIVTVYAVATVASACLW